MFWHLLVPLDGSELAESVLPHAEALAKQLGTELVNVTLLLVCEPSGMSTDFTRIYLDQRESEKQYMAYCKPAAERYLAAVGKRLRDAGFRVQSEVLVGIASRKIVDYANKNPIDLIVISTCGQSGPGFWPWGSVADKVLQGVSKPILLIRPQ